MNHTDYFRMGQASELLGCQAYHIAYLLTTRRIPEPYRVAGRRVFTMPELATISAMLKLDLGRDLQARAARRGK